ncbi:MAG: HTTM domain-containing protein [Polyangiaceae bacterium]|nr:HTTM domain-containing protein [Polyangiaceae bacterium]
MSAPSSSTGWVDRCLRQFPQPVVFFAARNQGYAASLFRICLGLIILLNGIRLLFNIERYYGESGAFPWATVAGFPEHAISLLRFAPTEPLFYTAICSIPLIAGLALTFGIFSRFHLFLFFLVMVSLRHRNPFLGNGGDHLLVILAFLGAFLPLDAHYSVATRLREKWTSYSRPASYSVWASRLIGLQLSYIYLYAFSSKVKYAAWWNGEALRAALAAPEISRWAGVLEPAGPLLSFAFLVGGVFTIAFEGLFPFFVWQKRSRLFAIAAGILFHCGIELGLRITAFSWLMISCYCLFLSDDQVIALMRLFRLEPRSKEAKPVPLSR